MPEDNQIKAAWITFWGLIITAIIGGLFLLFSKIDDNGPSPDVYTKSEDKRPDVTTIPKLPEVITTPTTKPKSKPDYGKIFDKDDPYPIGFKDIKIGIRLSVVRNLFPNGQLGLGYFVKLDEGAFEFLLADFRAEEVDPKITTLVYYFRDGAKDQIHKQALTAFGADRVEIRALGTIMYWPDINGYEVNVREKWLSIQEELQEWEKEREIKTESK